ncbi:hypothetical protein P4H71_08510 [Paenibacillus kribbensis]|uniref:hypothetical protein n=1 Tax=Paenibacillus kribbensis TaxID=172713 RepID=UPI002DBEAC98|nr:hypothetical protein [Paenibacillus kribbensis]MEC0234375.1 hypothetical protein [Paenibacillus kribbensis]
MKILYFSPIYWGDLKQRPQHLAEELAKMPGIHITFVEPSISILNSIVRQNSDYKKREQSVNDSLRIFRPSGSLRLPRSFESLDIFHWNQWFEKRQLQDLVSSADIIWLGSPVFYPLIKHINHKKIVFDRMDDYVFLTNNALMKKLLKKWELELLAKADLVISTSNDLYKHSLTLNKQSYLVKNAVDAAILNINVDSLVVSDLRRLKHEGYHIFGYVGAIDHWFDIEMVKAIIEFDERFIVCLVGRNNLTYNFGQHSRIKYYEPVPKSEIGAIIEVFDVCLYPFLRNSDRIDTINPVKIYEYLSLNKVTLAVESEETRLLNQEGVYLYNSLEEIRQYLIDIDTLQLPFYDQGQLENFVVNNDWKARAKTILELLIKELQ